MNGLLDYVKEREAVHRSNGELDQADKLKAILEHYSSDNQAGRSPL